MYLLRVYLIILIASLAFGSAQESKTESINSLIESRLKTIPLPDPSSYYGQNDGFAKAIAKSYCKAAAESDLYLGKEGWIFTRNTLVDFGREELKRNDLEYDEIVYWLNSYRQALTTVGFEEQIMMVVPSKTLVGEAYLTPELKELRSELNTEADHYTMRQAYLDAGFKHVPDLLNISRQAAKASEDTAPFPHYPTDHHFTSYSALLWSSEAAKAIMLSDIYIDLDKEPVKIQMKEEKHEEFGWEHMKVVAEICQTDYPAIYMPHYYLENDSTSNLLSDKEDDIVVIGSSNIGYQFNRAGSYGEVGTPGTGTADFLAHITHLDVLKYGIYSQANAAIEAYLRTDFSKKTPPKFLVQYLESHAFPYPAYNFRSLPALTYGKCETPVFQTVAPRKGRINVDLSGAELVRDSGEYYLWLELSHPAEKHSTWTLTEKYESGHTNMLGFFTDDRFMDYPTSFGLQLLPNQTNLDEIQIRPESGWKGESINVSVCNIGQVSEHYKKTSSPPENLEASEDISTQPEIYIPIDLEDSFKSLDEWLSPEYIATIKSETKDDMIFYHFSLGISLRNSWGLWEESRLSKWFNEQGIHHPDDMSGIILDSYWSYLNSKPIKLEEQIKFYQDYWGDSEEDSE